VNIAARLEAECPVGGICISRAVRDQVRLDLPYEPLGSLKLKNIARPVEAYVLRLDPAAKPQHGSQKRRMALSATLAALLIGASAAGWWLYRGNAPQISISSAVPPPYTPPDIGLTKAPRLSIVVLPFENLSGDPNDNYAAQGITEDITTDLSKIPGMFVIARETAFTYQGKAIDVRKVGEELGVRYALEGSVRRIGDTLRINAQLISAETGAHLWAERFDEKLNDLSEGQDAITSRIGGSLNITLVDIETARSKRERPTSPDAFDLILRARSLSLHPMSPKDHAERRALLEQLVQLDPHSIFGLTQLAYEISREQNFSNANGDDPERAANLLARAAAINSSNLYVLVETAHQLTTSNRYSEAVAAFQRILDEYPNASGVYYLMGANMMPLGRAEEAIPLIKETLRRDPRSGWNYDRYADLSIATMLIGRDEEAIVWAQRALAASPPYPFVRGAQNRLLAAAYARLGRLDEAHQAIVEANRIWPYNTVRTISPGPPFPPNPVFASQLARYRDGLRLAGLRDHADEDADFGVPADGKLQQSIPGFTPTTVIGADDPYRRTQTTAR
jgi:adenylate cyclase